MGYLYVETMLPTHRHQHWPYTGSKTDCEMALLHGDDCLRDGPVCAEHMTRPGTQA